MKEDYISVVIFEDNADLRESIRSIIDVTEGFKCVGAFSNCNNLINQLHRTTPDIVLMDIQMPGISGIEAVALLRTEFNELPVLMQTVFEDDANVFAAICAGANGYVLKNTPPLKFIDAIKETVEGGSPMTPSIAAKVLKFVQQQNKKTDKQCFDLSEREKEILFLLVDGLSYKLIAGKLFVSYETVHSHIKKIYQKLHVNSMNEAVSKALRNKLV